ncbi:MAG: DNA-binding protein [Bacteroidota bacterium]
MKLITTATLSFLFLLQVLGQPTKGMGANHPDVHKIVVKEVIQTTSYTYVQAEENGALQWIAVPKMEAKVGDTYYYQGGMQMGEFKSKELNRTFSSILFLNGLVSPEIVEEGKTEVPVASQKSKSAEETVEISIDPAKGGITIAELYSNREKYANKVVKIRGKVTRYNEKIMGKNWIHLQDGSASQEKHDLTVTTQDMVKVGDVITMEGMIVLDRDFGAGYFYSIIMESGRVVAQ